MKYASLCVLSYERPDFLIRSLESLKENTKYPYELIVNDDASLNQKVSSYLTEQYFNGHISHLILNSGQNMGVGRAFRNCIGVSNGDYIFKLDADLEYKPGWLETVVNIIENNKDAGCVGLFNYLNYVPTDERFIKLEEREDCNVVKDFVNSGYGFTRRVWDKFGHALGDDGWQVYVNGKDINLSGEKRGKYKSLIPKEDVADNFGFGRDSVYLMPGGGVRPKSKDPKIFK